MLEILSTLNNLTRIDLTLASDDWILASGVIGTWVTTTGANTAVQVSAGDYGFPIWSESNRLSTLAGFSPDIAATNKITVLYGKFRARTDQYSGTPLVGEKLFLDTDGKLCNTSAGKAHVVAVCIRGIHSVDVKYKGAVTATNVIEYVSV